ncbi:hypothetical protein FGO68_gene10951 [Halteria grandinella]|uniref:Uncharacterized protein n=1 Tax=Halteria grandinella TaxID=5974 RepID=A0A8J8P211_HALGN|nr:hypothetical protein FGO68_gene10951 [Halteria grandinella]
MFLPVSIGGLINLYSLKGKQNGEQVASFMAIVIVIAFMLTPLVFTFTIIRNKEAIQSEDEQYVSRFGTLTHKLKTKAISHYLYHTLTVQKWQLTVIILIYLRNVPSLQAIILLFQSMMMQIYLLRYKPFVEPRDNILELINEFLYCIYIYSYIMISDYFDLQNINSGSLLLCRSLGGWTLIGVIGASLVINIGFMIWNGVKEVKSKIPNKFLRVKRSFMNMLTKKRVPKYETNEQRIEPKTNLQVVTQVKNIPNFIKILELEEEKVHDLPTIAPRTSLIETNCYLQSTLQQINPNDGMQRRIPQLNVIGLGPCIEERPKGRKRFRSDVNMGQDGLFIRKRGAAEIEF